ncbi:bifunctional folylpolyglutamate synthase/dihydrofolate synthase [Aquimarina aquimarini]|uniref:bifunctional folylpolyglutamate synthase/dihydrofolate synthase n=1 Tax=Aquimarina aquimarini TaxID=1191734 RepID=UPI000D5515FF|nr:folylpolyglutamate synthase/dihydrofolate synthase family protein [Aquimarina aquimarini]
MNYRETLNWMFAQLPMYQRQGASAYKIDLQNTIQLAAYLKNPENAFKSIHVGGTNGKGSVSHMLASVMQEAGYKVGLYTSPHLKDFRERIRVNGEKVPKAYVVDFIASHQRYFETNQLSFFEMTVGMAFQYFATSEVDIAIIEVGLGGRLDSTNIITPEISVITNIGLDHTRFLGDTISKIAKEKAGIIKKNIPVVVGKTIKDAEEVFIETSRKLHSRLYIAEDFEGETYTSDLKGDYQKENIKTVLQTVDVMKSVGWEISDKSIKEGLLQVRKNTHLLGRWHILQEEPKVICDTAHNEDGLLFVMKQLSDEKYDRLHIVLGVVDDKDLDTILPLFPMHAQYYFVKPDILRGLDAEKLKKKAVEFNLVGKKYDSVTDAYESALQQATSNDVVYVGGSTFVVAEIL